MLTDTKEPDPIRVERSPHPHSQMRGWRGQLAEALEARVVTVTIVSLILVHICFDIFLCIAEDTGSNDPHSPASLMVLCPR